MSELRLAPGQEDFISSSDIARRTSELADFYSRRYGEEEVIVITVMQGAMIFAANLLQKIKNPNIITDYVRVKSMQGTSSNGRPMINKDPDHHIKDNRVLVIDDIDDTRRTLGALLPRLRASGPAQLDVVTLLNKPLVQKTVELPADDIQYGFDIASRFVVGHGLDWNQRYRALPHISVARNIAPEGQSDFWTPIVPDENVFATKQAYNPSALMIAGL